MRRLLKILFRTVELSFIVLCVFALWLVFREVSIPRSFVENVAARYLPTNLVLRVESMSIGFSRGVCIDGLRVSDLSRSDAVIAPIFSAESISIDVLSRSVVVEGARYERLFDSYYAPGNQEKNARVEVTLPTLPSFSLTLVRPRILGVAPDRVTAEVDVDAHRFSFERIHLDWPETDLTMYLDGFCWADFERQEVRGEVHGTALQKHIRPLLVALDVPSALPYIDGFTEVRGKIPAVCAWHVNLVNNDFSLDLGLKPELGRYNRAPLTRASGDLHLFVYTRGTSLNYRHVFGPIIGVGPKGEPLNGTVRVEGTNGFNVVSVEAKSGLPIASLLKIGGFTGKYVDDSVIGDAACNLEFRFPRAHASDVAYLNGTGHLEIKKGLLMRLPIFKGLMEAMPPVAPAVSWMTDSTQAVCDYAIKNGVVRSENIFIEGSLYSILMYGQYDAVRDKLDFTVRVQFAQRDSWLGKVLHPLTWPFTKLLLEFRLTGSSESPKWEYVSVIDRVLGATK